ncbi:unnamed protein product [Candidula unifasciata]|uniref:F-box domain-containing protein n=1 Tax=Candidula unifasciata TaxID=100452 RepID=A0A8S3YSJ5_9EUPU|nr:unnamed protein product [Candidula unifasciata]
MPFQFSSGLILFMDMDDSLACSDFGDCRSITSSAAASLATHQPDPVKADGEQNPNLTAKKDQESICPKNLFMDNGEFLCRESMLSSKKGAENDVTDGSVSVSYGTCTSVSPVDACDMTRYVSGSSLPSDGHNSSSAPDGCTYLQHFPSHLDESRLVLNKGFDAKMEYSQAVVQSKHKLDVSSNLVSQSEDEQRRSLKLIHSDSSHVHVIERKVLSESDFRFDEKSDVCMDSNPHVCDEDGISHFVSDGCHSFLGAITLDQLDDDVLYHIARFLEARVLRFALSLVCRRFYAMFANETYWRTRITVKWPKPYPAVSCLTDFNWVDAYVEREDNYRVWKDAAGHKHHFKYSYNLFGGVDAVHLMKDGQLVVCGDRSRTLNLIDFSKYSGPDSDEVQMQDMLCHTDRVVHQGWIWSIASAGNNIVTGSWDTYVRMFDVEAGCQLASNFKCHSSVLSLYAENNETIASCSDRKVYFFDHRTSAARSETFHTQPVLCVAGNDNFVISGSEDKSVSVFDRRAGKIFIMFKLKNYPLCMSYTENQLWFGDRTGTLHLHDGTDGLFQHVGSYDIGHTEKMTGVVSTRGAIYTCSGDRSIKVLHPTTDPDIITTLAVHDKEIAKIDYNNGVLVSAGGDDCIGVWLPKHWGSDTYLI